MQAHIDTLSLSPETLYPRRESGPFFRHLPEVPSPTRLSILCDKLQAVPARVNGQDDSATAEFFAKQQWSPSTMESSAKSSLPSLKAGPTLPSMPSSCFWPTESASPPSAIPSHTPEYFTSLADPSICLPQFSAQPPLPFSGNPEPLSLDYRPRFSTSSVQLCSMTQLLEQDRMEMEWMQRSPGSNPHSMNFEPNSALQETLDIWCSQSPRSNALDAGLMIRQDFKGGYQINPLVDSRSEDTNMTQSFRDAGFDVGAGPVRSHEPNEEIYWELRPLDMDIWRNEPILEDPTERDHQSIDFSKEQSMDRSNDMVEHQRHCERITQDHRAAEMAVYWDEAVSEPYTAEPHNSTHPNKASLSYTLHSPSTANINETSPPTSPRKPRHCSPGKAVDDSYHGPVAFRLAPGDSYARGITNSMITGGAVFKQVVTTQPEKRPRGRPRGKRNLKALSFNSSSPIEDSAAKRRRIQWPRKCKQPALPLSIDVQGGNSRKEASSPRTEALASVVDDAMKDDHAKSELADNRSKIQAGQNQRTTKAITPPRSLDRTRATNAGARRKDKANSRRKTTTRAKLEDIDPVRPYMDEGDDDHLEDVPTVAQQLKVEARELENRVNVARRAILEGGLGRKTGMAHGFEDEENQENIEVQLGQVYDPDR